MNATDESRLNSSKSVAVSTKVFWNTDMTKCPIGVKVQLWSIGGVACYGIYRPGDTFWKGWQNVPGDPATAHLYTP